MMLIIIPHEVGILRTLLIDRWPWKKQRNGVMIPGVYKSSGGISSGPDDSILKTKSFGPTSEVNK